MNQPIQLRQAVVIGNELALAWKDDTESFLPLDMLRRACPCAHCQGEPDALGRVVRPTQHLTPVSFSLASFSQVGGYALQLAWADGHQSGIYSFHYLRQLGHL